MAALFNIRDPRLVASHPSNSLENLEDGALRSAIGQIPLRRPGPCSGRSDRASRRYHRLEGLGLGRVEEQPLFSLPVTCITRLKTGLLCRDYLSNTLTWLYIVMKCLYVVNIVAQLCLLNRFLGTQHHLFWGFNVFRGLLQGTLATYTVQCAALNMLNEKLFVLMWAMLCPSAPITTLNAIYALVKAALPRNGTVNKWLKHGPVYELGQVRRFASEGLQGDGMLVLGFVENHAGLGVTREVTGKLMAEFSAAIQQGTAEMTPLLPDVVKDPLPARAPPRRQRVLAN
ncbi:unnamed protein product, partial [Mesorhabditis spiculigera]